jgi:Co/Zn/Cd efflux system component
MSNQPNPWDTRQSSEQQPAFRPGPYPQGYPGQFAPEHPQGTTVLVLGILGLFVPVVAFIAWYQGSKVEKEIQASGIYYANAGFIRVGRILGIVGGILTMVVAALLIVQLVVMLLTMIITMGAAFGG